MASFDHFQTAMNYKQNLNQYVTLEQEKLSVDYRVIYLTRNYKAMASNNLSHAKLLINPYVLEALN